MLFMFINTYDFNLERPDGSTVAVSLRLNLAAQKRLKAKYKENTQATLFGAMDDLDRLIDVMDAALKWAGNTNELTSGEELIDLMAMNGMLGIEGKNHVIVAIGEASGLFSHNEAEVINAKTTEAFRARFYGEGNDADDIPEGDGKN